MVLRWFDEILSRNGTYGTYRTYGTYCGRAATKKIAPLCHALKNVSIRGLKKARWSWLQS